MKAHSLASAPELAKNTRPPSGCPSPTRRSRIAATSGPTVVPNRFDTCSRVRAWVASASATAGCEWPSEVTASPERKSR